LAHWRVNVGNIVTTSLIGRSTSIGSPATFYRLFMERFLRDEALIERRYLTAKPNSFP